MHIYHNKKDGKTRTTICYNKDNLTINTLHFGAQDYPDYTVAPHDQDIRTNILKYSWIKNGMIIWQLVRYQNIFMRIYT